MHILKQIKKYYFDSADPEGRALHLATRSAIACFISVMLFQYIGKFTLAGWAGFAALAFIQIDTLETVSKRIKFLIANIWVFAILALIGISLGKYYFWFTLTVPFVVFTCGYISYLGNEYYNAGAWAGFLYIAFGSSLGGISHAKEVALTFIFVGILCLFISIAIFPEIPLARIKKSFKRILVKLDDLYYSNQEIHKDKINKQLENLIAIQNSTINTYLTLSGLSKSQEDAIVNASKALQQIILMLKSIVALSPQLLTHSNYPKILFDKCERTTQILIANAFNRLNASSNKTIKLDLSLIINGYRDDLKIIQKQELMNASPDFRSLLDYSSYLYHYIKLWQKFIQFSNELDFVFIIGKSI